MKLSRLALLVLCFLVAACGTQPPPLPDQAAEDRVAVDIDRFGVGSVIRPGSYAGLRIVLTSGFDEAKNFWVQWEVPNADGDIAEYGRPIGLGPNDSQTEWLYTKLPPETSTENVWNVRVFEFEDGERGAEVGGTQVAAANRLDKPIAAGVPQIFRNNSIIGVVGQMSLGLEEYLTQATRRNAVQAANEETRIAANLFVGSFPDSWEGFEPFEAIVWGPDQNAGTDPQQLQGPRAEALREYIRRGGHLVIVLPPEQVEMWYGDGLHELRDLLPEDSPLTQEEVPLSELLPVLGKNEVTPVDFNTKLHVFKTLEHYVGGAPVDSLTGSTYDPLIATPDGRVVAAQSLFGHGRITLVGIPISGRMRGITRGKALPQADVFWNRVFGRRADTPTARELDAIEQANRLTSAVAAELDLGGGALMRDQITMSKQAGQGLLLAIILFGLYWVVAGPAGFFTLKRYRRVQHSWLIFAATAGVFTALAWGSVGLLGSHSVEIRHVTFLDHIAEPTEVDSNGNAVQRQRAIGWFSAYLPGYGDTPIEIDDGQADAGNLLSSWVAPDVERTPFQNVDRYQIESRDPSSFAIPSRATATHFEANWMGNVDPNWGGMIKGTVTVTRAPDGAEVLDADVWHDLPGNLTNVMAIWVHNGRNGRNYAVSGDLEQPWIANPDSAALPNRGYFIRRTAAQGDWLPGQNNVWTLDLSRNMQGIGSAQLERNLEEYTEQFKSQGIGANAMGGSINSTRRRTFMEMLSLHHMLEPPTYLKEPNRESESTVFVYRKLGQGLDLSPWFVRPCLIIIAYLEDSPTPIPIRVDGDVPESSGLTVVRWIYPLDVDEQIAFPEPKDEDDETD